MFIHLHMRAPCSRTWFPWACVLLNLSYDLRPGRGTPRFCGSRVSSGSGVKKFGSSMISCPPISRQHWFHGLFANIILNLRFAAPSKLGWKFDTRTVGISSWTCVNTRKCENWKNVTLVFGQNRARRLRKSELREKWGNRYVSYTWGSRWKSLNEYKRYRQCSKEGWAILCIGQLWI